MAYWGYLKFIKSFLSERCRPCPTVLEIGVDMGQSFIPLLVYMVHNFSEFSLVGCDVIMKPELRAILCGIAEDITDTQSSEDVKIVIKSSLEFLPELISTKKASGHSGFDVIMIDGDHNYYTVSKELKYCAELLATGGIMMVDDYNGRYAKKDLYYSDLETHKNVKGTTMRTGTESEKKGVKTAVDEFLRENPEWTIISSDHEPAFLYRKKELSWYPCPQGRSIISALNS